MVQDKVSMWVWKEGHQIYALFLRFGGFSSYVWGLPCTREVHNWDSKNILDDGFQTLAQSYGSNMNMGVELDPYLLDLEIYRQFIASLISMDSTRLDILL